MNFSALFHLAKPWCLSFSHSRCYELELQNCVLNELSVAVSRQQSGQDEVPFTYRLGEIWVREQWGVLVNHLEWLWKEGQGDSPFEQHRYGQEDSHGPVAGLLVWAGPRNAFHPFLGLFILNFSPQGGLSVGFKAFPPPFYLSTNFVRLASLGKSVWRKSMGWGFEPGRY